MTTLRAVLLAGGQSSRMGMRKELLRLPSDEPVFIQKISLIHKAVPESDRVYLSLRNRAALQELLEFNEVQKLPEDRLLLKSRSGPLHVQVLYDHDDAKFPEHDDIGPASGLLRAQQQDPTCNWLIVACDYPLLTADALRKLREGPAGVVTCFHNEEGYSEPLLAIWTPEALSALGRNVRQGILGPSSVIRQLNSTLVAPESNEWLMNVNTREDWDRIVTIKTKQIDM
ncbi:hypothetical protein E8E15_007842 [Penicillium rubens]|jgi:molybdopterin-guanine dinucleotide biosynthesis protein A|uniref:Molybdenum cofactor biosynthesis bifunctional protein n=1 Tax=Penicillium chrysogenum TaxID=5076 RepID=A0A167SK14_PENCH|nr:nucleotide-diphospho-sugar transferase [Penicillium rubens]KAF3023351.1 hypothetical protein E8E15_007842 [Penicillium rubens]KAJ5830526.1 nucleotide-diphospho-sugar transferase [Penicillium rubens]KAJ5854106.1 nucleotide-diphospho-sugar transferase [Penicillium rubens]KZN87276.1 Molybdenum cofactor biosynthesis bifunctional protein [Penicillium chrysogenum]